MLGASWTYQKKWLAVITSLSETSFFEKKYLPGKSKFENFGTATFLSQSRKCKTTVISNIFQYISLMKRLEPKIRECEESVTGLTPPRLRRRLDSPNLMPSPVQDERDDATKYGPFFIIMTPYLRSNKTHDLLQCI